MLLPLQEDCYLDQILDAHIRGLELSEEIGPAGSGLRFEAGWNISIPVCRDLAADEEQPLMASATKIVVSGKRSLAVG
jgi:hypothetical protein